MVVVVEVGGTAVQNGKNGRDEVKPAVPTMIPGEHPTLRSTGDICRISPEHVVLVTSSYSECWSEAGAYS